MVIAGHLDTVPIADNVPSWVTEDGDGTRIWGRGACDMKGGVAVQLAAAARLAAPSRDVTWIFYDNEEVEEDRNGLSRLARERPEQLAGSFAVLCEPSNARIEGGCQGTMRVEVELTGVGRPLGPVLDGAQRHPRRGRGAAAAGRRTSRSRSRSTG